MLNAKKTIRQNNHSSEVLYSGFVTAITPKPIAVLISTRR